MFKKTKSNRRGSGFSWKRLANYGSMQALGIMGAGLGAAFLPEAMAAVGVIGGANHFYNNVIKDNSSNRSSQVMSDQVGPYIRKETGGHPTDKVGRFQPGDNQVGIPGGHPTDKVGRFQPGDNQVGTPVKNSKGPLVNHPLVPNRPTKDYSYTGKGPVGENLGNQVGSYIRKETGGAKDYSYTGKGSVGENLAPVVKPMSTGEPSKIFDMNMLR